MGCDFCSTSAKFGGKGKYVSFFKTGDDLFDFMIEVEKAISAQSFTMLDENFLLDRRRALRLLDLMVKHDKSWELATLSSAQVLASYDIRQIVRMGLSCLWVGIEGKKTHYEKLNGIDTRKLIAEHQSHGMKFIGSTILGFLDQKPEDIDPAIDYAVAHNVELMQFMLYFPSPGTPLFEQITKMGIMKGPDELAFPDWNAQRDFNFRHPLLPEGCEVDFMPRAFTRDFQANGPSVLRLFERQFVGWKRYRNDPDPCIRARFNRSTNATWAVFAASMAWAARKYFKKENPRVTTRIDNFLQDLYKTFGPKTRLSAPILGRAAYRILLHEEKSLAKGKSYEPACRVTKNRAALMFPDRPRSSGVAERKTEVPWDG
jgi:hypothetical protein